MLESEDRVQTLALSGTITAIGTDVVSDTCLTSGLVIGDSVLAADDEVQTFSIATDDTVTVVSFKLRDPFPFRDGDAVDLTWEFSQGGFSPDRGRLLITGDDDRIVYVEEAGRLEELAPPAGVSLARGEQSCWADDGCGGWARYDVIASSGNEEAALSPSTSSTIDGAQFRSSALSAADPQQGDQCDDWFVAHVVVSAVR